MQQIAPHNESISDMAKKLFGTAPPPMFYDEEPRHVVRERDVSKLPDKVLSDRQKRRALCGMKIIRRVNGSKHRVVTGTYHCGLWHGGFCPKCAEYRAHTMKNCAKAALKIAKDKGQKLKSIKVSNERANSLTRKAGKDNYRRIPRDEDEIELLILEEFLDPDDFAEDVTESWIEQQDWIEKTDTPGTKNITGNLGKEQEVVVENENPSEWATIETKTLVVDPNKTTKEIDFQALTEAYNDKVHVAMVERVNAEDDLEKKATLVQETLEYFVDLYEERIKANGGNILRYNTRNNKEEIQISCIYWTIPTEDDINRMVSKSVLPEELPDNTGWNSN